MSADHVVDVSLSEDSSLSIYKQLITSSQKLDTSFAEWNRICDASRSCLRRIATLFEHLSNCRAVQLDNITSFSTVTRDKLVYKIEVAVEDELAQLTTNLKQLEPQLFHIKGVCRYVRTTYADKWRDLPLQSLFETNNLFPPIACVLDYFEDILRLFSSDFLCRKAALGMIDLTDESTFIDLQTQWKCGPLKNVDQNSSGVPSLYYVWKASLDNMSHCLTPLSL